MREEVEIDKFRLGVFSTGDLIALIIAIVVSGISWGTMGSDMAHMREEINSMRIELAELAARPITAEADRRLSVIEAKEAGEEIRFLELKNDIKEQLNRIEKKLDEYEKRNR